MTYRLIFWGNSSHSVKIFRTQRHIIRIIKDHRHTDSCTDLFKKLKIVPVQLSLVFVINNKDPHKVNLQTDSIYMYTRPNSYLHQM